MPTMRNLLCGGVGNNARSLFAFSSRGQGLAHASITLTLDVYSHVLPDMQKAATDKLENILFKRTGAL